MSANMDRREFIEKAAVPVAAGVGVNALSARNAAASPSGASDITVGVMGLSRGRALADLFAKQSGVHVKYVCDVDQTRAVEAAKGMASKVSTPPEPVGDFRRILDDRDVDILVCAAPNHWHGPATILACAAGKHVYVEKPCSHNGGEGELMIAAARKNNRAVQVGMQRRSGPLFQQAAEEIRGGIIGRAYHARCWYANIRPPIGTGKPAEVPDNLNYELWQGPAPRTPYLDNRVHYNWHWFWHWGNGELGNNGVHTLDICRWMLGVDYPVQVTSSGGRYRYNDDQETPDTHVASFDFANNKSICWQGLSCNRHSHPFAIIYGESGTVQINQGGDYIVYDERDKEVKKVGGKPRGDNEHVVNLLDAIRNEKPLELNADIEIGHKSALLCHLGNIAHRTGRTIACDPQNGHVQGDAEAAKLWSRDYEPGWEPKV